MDTLRRTYSIREVAQLTGLPASTLRYYEDIGVTPPVGRGETSGHRIYEQEDLDLVSWVACLAATGMPVSQLREYVANGRQGAAGATDQIRLLTGQAERLEEEARLLVVRRRYVQLKIDFWQAVEAGDEARSEQLADEAAALADDLHRSGR